MTSSGPRNSGDRRLTYLDGLNGLLAGLPDEAQPGQEGDLLLRCQQSLLGGDEVLDQLGHLDLVDEGDGLNQPLPERGMKNYIKGFSLLSHLPSKKNKMTKCMTDNPQG